MEIKWHAIKLQCWLIGLQCHLYATRFKCQFMVNVVKDVLELNVITKKYEKKKKKTFLAHFVFLFIKNMKI